MVVVVFPLKFRVCVGRRESSETQGLGMADPSHTMVAVVLFALNLRKTFWFRLKSVGRGME